MLNGQLPLTDAISPGASARLPRLAFTAVILLVLAGCASGPAHRAPIVDLSHESTTPSTASATVPSGSTYVVKPGDSLYRIARNNNLDVENLKRWNSINDANQISVGQVIKLSGPASAPTPIASTTTAPAPSGHSEPVPLDPPPANNAPAPANPPAAVPAAPAPTPTPPRAADAGVISWGWPAQGAVMQTFNSNTKGIDIAGSPGDPVVAAADGKVMYSGKGVRGYGNLVIINHENGFITAYAHNRALMTKAGQNVKRGAKIAEIGDTDANEPKLHFEVRRQGTPVDPLQYLPPR